MQVAIAGPTGQIGSEVCLLYPTGIPLFRSKLNLTNQFSVKQVLNEEKFEVLINCAGITDLSFCEEHPEIADAVNHQSVRQMAEFCKINDRKLLHISDAMVFDGTYPDAYDTDKIPNPINVYGKTKYEAEIAITEVMEPGTYTIIRTSSVFGPALGRTNFLEKLISSAMRCKEAVKAPSWRYVTPTSSRAVAKAIQASLGEGHLPPLLHVACDGGVASQAEVAAFVLENIPSLSHMKVAPVAKPGKTLPRVPAVTALKPSTVPPPLGWPTWQNEVRDYLLQKGYARPACAVEVENDAPYSVSQVWEKLQRGTVSFDALVIGLRQDRSNWMAGIEGPNRKAKKGFWAKFGEAEEKEEASE